MNVSTSAEGGAVGGALMGRFGKTIIISMCERYAQHMLKRCGVLIMRRTNRLIFLQFFFHTLFLALKKLFIVRSTFVGIIFAHGYLFFFFFFLFFFVLLLLFVTHHKMSSIHIICLIVRT